AGAKPEQPVCEQAVAFSLGGLQELKLLTLFAKHFHIQVAVGFDPILVDFDRQRTNEPQAALLIRKDSDDMGAAFELLIDPLEHIGALKKQTTMSTFPRRTSAINLSRPARLVLVPEIVSVISSTSVQPRRAQYSRSSCNWESWFCVSVETRV